jgi:hypothetical protein
LCLDKRHASGRPNDDVIHILKPVDFSVTAITDGIDAGLFPTPVVVESVNSPRQRASVVALDSLADQHFRELWQSDNASHWGRFLAEKLPQRKSPVDRRTVKQLETWKKAEKRRSRTGQIRGRLQQVGMPKEFLEQLEDSDAASFQRLIDDKLDSETKSQLKKDPELLRLFQDQLNDMVSPHVQKDDGAT